MALAFSAAKVIPPGQPTQQWYFDVIQDGTNTTGTLALPVNFPVFTANPGPAAPDGVTLNTTAAVSAALRVLYTPSNGGTGVVTVVKCVPNASNPSTQLDVTLSAAGTNGLTARIVAIVADGAY